MFTKLLVIQIHTKFLNTLFAFNLNQMVIRILNAYLRRITEAGGTGVIAYTEGITESYNRKRIKIII